MILVDTSVWIDHLRAGNEALAALLDKGQVLAHPFVIGELALGNLRQRHLVIEALRNLPQAKAATDEEVLGFVEDNRLHGLGVGYVDAHLLAAARLTRASLWTQDKRLMETAERLGVALKSSRPV